MTSQRQHQFAQFSKSNAKHHLFNSSPLCLYIGRHETTHRHSCEVRASCDASCASGFHVPPPRPVQGQCLPWFRAPALLLGLSRNRFVPAPLAQIAVTSSEALATHVRRGAAETCDGLPPPSLARRVLANTVGCPSNTPMMSVLLVDARTSSRPLLSPATGAIHARQSTLDYFTLTGGFLHREHECANCRILSPARCPHGHVSPASSVYLDPESIRDA